MTDDNANTPPAQQTQQKSPGKWLKVALVASLAFNLLIVSAVATRIVRGGGERMPPGSYVQLVPRNFLRELPADQRQQAQAILRGFAKEARGGRQMARDTANKLADAVAADPYDVARVKSVIDGFASESGRIAAQGGEAALQVIALLTPEQRQALAESLRQRAAMGKGRQ